VVEYDQPGKLMEREMIITTTPLFRELVRGTGLDLIIQIKLTASQI
jgi:hypothetical protein